MKLTKYIWIDEDEVILAEKINESKSKYVICFTSKNDRVYTVEFNSKKSRDKVFSKFLKTKKDLK